MEDEATVIGEPSAFELGFSVQITNNSENIDTIRVERTLISLFEGASHYFCWGTFCYPPNPDSIYISSLSLILQPGKTSGLYVFAAFALPNGTIGNSIVCYTFFNENDVDENISITVNYNTSLTSVNKPGFLKNSVKIWPNPATGLVNIHTASDILLLEVFRPGGQLVLKTKPNLSLFKMNSSSLEPGIYLFRVVQRIFIQ